MTTVVLEDLVTSKYLEKIFKVTPMTLYNWRKHRGLPVITIPGSDTKKPIRFDKQKVQAWALVQGIPCEGLD